MNQQAYEAGKAAYQKGDWIGTVSSLSQAKEPGEVSGKVDHLIGNAYMKLGQYEAAANAYRTALEDTTYGKVGALSCNRGRALLAAGHPEEAVQSLANALQDQSYATPYKAHMALGSAYERLGDVRNAGIAYRNAAIDESNPNPSVALCDLGSCFMRLGRPVDAVEAYRTALDFSTPLQDQNKVYCDLGLAYVAANRMSEAVDAFDRATADGTLKLSPEARASYDAARRAMAQITSKRPSDTDALLAAAGYNAYDPLDPTGESGELMPSAEDTGFFSVSEEDLIAQDAKERKVRRKHNHRGLKVFITILIILIVLVGAGALAYYRGYGWPTQQTVVEDVFEAKTNGSDLSEYLSSSLSDTARSAIEDAIPSGATITITGTERSMTESTVHVSVTLATGGTEELDISMTRDGISWKISGISVANSTANADTTSSTSTTTSTDTTSGTTADTTSTESTTSTDTSSTDTSSSSTTTSTSGTTQG